MPESPPTMPESPPPQKRYHPVKDAPFTLVERVRVAFEESLYEQGIEFLNGLLFSGISAPGETPQPALMPPPAFLRLLLTVMAHPFYTTQMRHPNDPKSIAPISAYILMRRIITTLGPVGAGLEQVWNFDRGGRSTRRARKDRSLSPSPDDQISGELGNEEGLFSRIEDVWSLVGWAFVCSVKHPARWEVWRNVLDCLVTTLEEDWNVRCARFEASNREDITHLENSIIYKMLPDTSGTAGYRRTIRAILTTGTDGLWGNEFGRVWDDELLKVRPIKKGQRGLDSFMGEDADAEQKKMDKATGKAKKNPKKKSPPHILDENDEPLPESEDVDMTDAPVSGPTTVDEWGGMQSFLLRQRFFMLLSNVSYHDGFIGITDLYREFKDCINQYSLPAFKMFVTTLVPIDIEYRSTFNQIFLESLLSGEAPPASKRDGYGLTQDVLVHRLLAYPAKTHSPVENAKVAILLEVLMRLLFSEHFLVWTQALEDSVEAGIAARKKRASFRHKGSNGVKDDRETVERLWSISEDSLRLMVKCTKLRHEAGP